MYYQLEASGKSIFSNAYLLTWNKNTLESNAECVWSGNISS